ncbi:MAG TPA: DUF4157 domain-containing protein [Pyrinomonadaceae bacterium]
MTKRAKTVTAAVAAQPAATARPGLLQRKCACGVAGGVGGRCSDCDRQKLRMKRGPGPQVGHEAVPPSVQRTLRSSGRPLDEGTRALMEPRFGHDFSRVRVHTDAGAARSAADVSARAYTVGQNVVFGAGEYAPHSPAGQRLLAHELAHTVQQSGGAISASGELSVGPADDPFEREADAAADAALSSAEPARASLSPARVARAVLQRQPAPADDPHDYNMPAIWFRLNSTQLRSDSDTDSRIHYQHSLERIRAYLARTSAEGHVNIYGYASVEGGESANQNLSQQRADRVKAMLVADGIPAAQMTAVGRGETNSMPTLALNRRVELQLVPHATVIDMPEMQVTAEVPKFVCGPDVTSPVADAIADTKSAFGGWSPSQKEDACDALDSLRTGGMAWDIVELHNQDWIHQNYRPPCATKGATPACGASVQVDEDCHYAGSVNYVIFGVMCKLCRDYYYSIMLINTGVARFTRSSMLDLIRLYKGSWKSTGLGSPSANYQASRDWAEAGYDDWPSAASPTGDRSNCRPICPTPYGGGSFLVNWHPNQYYTGGGGR